MRIFISALALLAPLAAALPVVQDGQNCLNISTDGEFRFGLCFANVCHCEAKCPPGRPDHLFAFKVPFPCGTYECGKCWWDPERLLYPGRYVCWGQGCPEIPNLTPMIDPIPPEKIWVWPDNKSTYGLLPLPVSLFRADMVSSSTFNERRRRRKPDCELGQ